jgi:hypothetical protein
MEYKYLKTRNPKNTICTKYCTDLILMHNTSLGRAHYYAQAKGFFGNQPVKLPVQEEVKNP